MSKSSGKKKKGPNNYFLANKCFKENPKGELIRQLNKRGKIKK